MLVPLSLDEPDEEDPLPPDVLDEEDGDDLCSSVPDFEVVEEVLGEVVEDDD